MITEFSLLETPYLEVALPLPLRTIFTYSRPADLRVSAGMRVMVPFRNRRMTGYVVAGVGAAPAGVKARPVVDVLDDSPLFNGEQLELYRWIARYYHEALGEVIRAALPAGLEQSEERVIHLSDVGRERLDAVLDNLQHGDRAILDALGSGEHALEAFSRDQRIPIPRLRELADQGLLAIVTRRTQAAARKRLVRVACFLAEPTRPPVSKKETAVLDSLREERAIPISVLNRRFKNVKANVDRLQASGAITVEERRVFRDVVLGGGDEGASASPLALTEEQGPVVERLIAAVQAGGGSYLLHGVTGSGKTEVYLQVIAEVLAGGRGAIVLVPEIALTPQLVSRFTARFGEQIAVLHSGLSPGERLDQWSQIASGDRSVVIGARSAIFAPLPACGLIVVDEEHETSFKQEERPRYNARDLALVRGKLGNCTVVLGSATPSLETHFNALQGKHEHLRMRERVHSRAMPAVEVADLRIEARVGPNGLLTERLAVALKETVARGEQAILFINRRGFSSFVLCRSCGYLPECNACSISLSHSRRQGSLRCHYCGHSEGVPSICPKCQEGVLEPVGFGTERVEEDVATLLGPEVGISRMDRDTAQGKGLQRILEAFRSGKTRVLVGTQMVAKGHDFPGVTLVGVLLADHGLKFPDFRASERTFQLVTQVAGRAGRGEKPGRVLVQTYDPEHPSLKAAMKHDVEAFLSEELPVRELRGYPPHAHLALVKVTDTDAERAERVARGLVEHLAPLAERHRVWVLGPAFAPIQRIKNKTRVQVLLKSADRDALHRVLTMLDTHVDACHLAGTVALDVDPHSLL